MGRSREILADLSIPNGLDWTADGRQLLFIDTPTRRVDRFDIGPTGRTISGRRTAVEIAAGPGWPDGMTIDADGFLWVCLWDGWAVERYAPDGRLDRRVELPAAQVTSCAFGGRDLDELFITTGQEGFPPGGQAGPTACRGALPPSAGRPRSADPSVRRACLIRRASRGGTLAPTLRPR